jgi:hypothetical protein
MEKSNSRINVYRHREGHLDLKKREKEERVCDDGDSVILSRRLGDYAHTLRFPPPPPPLLVKHRGESEKPVGLQTQQ